MEEKSRFQKALDFIIPGRTTEEKTQSNYNQLFGNDSSIYGYNTSSGFWESDKLKEIGDGSGNSAVVACLNVLATSFSEPKLHVVKKDTKFLDNEKIAEHPLTKLYSRPNPFMSANLLSHYIVLALNTLGDAFLYKNRNGQGKVVELVPLMPHLVEVRGNENQLITHYDYYLYGKGEKIELPVEDIVHIRQGIDPNDHRRGHAPLKTVLREILGDESAGQFTAALLNNMAVPGVVLTPRNDGFGGPTREEAESISQMYKEKFGGANRGAPMVLSGAMNIDIVSFSPDQMKLAELRRIPEERVSAVLGVPAILAGLGAGLDSATYNNTKELREFFTEQKLVPMWRTVAAELTHQLLIPDFKDQNLECMYDIQNVRALQTDMDELYKRVNMGVSGGWITIGEARQVVGLDVDEKHDVYLRPLNMIQVDTDGQAILNDTPQENRSQAAQVAKLPEAAGYRDDVNVKDIMDGRNYPVESTRQPRIQQNEEPRNEEKYVAQMPNGAWCVISHDDGKVIKCFDTEKEANAYLKRKPKKDYDSIEELGVSLEEAEVLMESQFEIEPENSKAANPKDIFDNPGEAMNRSKELSCAVGVHTHKVNGKNVFMPCKTHEEYEEAIKPKKSEKPKKDRTNFPSPGDDKQVSISNSKYKQFPYGYAKDLKENWPEIWRRAGNGGNPPTSFTGNDAFRNWTKYKSGDRSESVLNWVRRRERYMGRHQGNNRLNGTIANIKWGGVSNIGVSAMKKIINDQKKVVRSRRKAAADLAEEMADDIALKAVSGRIRKILTEKAKNHNAKNPKYRTNARTLAAVFRRGVGAYRTNPGSVRGNVTGADQWGLARVNGFLHALRTGRFKRKPYDQDLLPSSHPLSSKKSGEKAASVRVGQSVSWSINKDPDPPSTVHGIVTSVSDGEATMQVYAILDNGKHKKTDRKVTMPVSKLTVIKNIKDE